MATPQIWSSIFKVNTETDIENKLRELAPKNITKINPGDDNWFIDQEYLYRVLLNNPSLVELKREIRRLEPTYLIDFNVNFKEYDDAHFHRGQYNQERLIDFMRYIRKL
jgi:hypothetical protein